VRHAIRVSVGFTLSLACGDAGDDGTEATTSGDDASTEASTSLAPDDDGSASGADDADVSGDADASDDADVSEDDGDSGNGGANGCGLAPGTIGESTIAVSAAGLDREAILVVPAGYDPDTAWPLVFAFHGLGSNAGQLRFYAGVEEASDGAAIVVYPEGLPLDDMGGATGWDLAAAGRDVAFFDALWAELDATLCLDHARVYATGHSFGGWMSNTLGCLRADVLAAIAPVAGGGPLEACSGTVAAWIAHGEDDPIVFTSLGEGSRDHWVAANGCDAASAPTDPPPCAAYEGCDAGLEVVWCLHTEGEAGQLTRHLWPSFAGAAIWAFFAAH
jgi:poly(3-hydroxybutyrate) depolymerase